MSDYPITLCTEADIDEICRVFVRDFIPDEYACCALGFTEQDAATLRSFVGHAIASGVSLKCCDGGTGDIVGFRLTTIWNVRENQPPPDLTGTTPKEDIMIAFTTDLTSDVKPLLPDATKVLKFEALSVNKNYRRKGLAVAMLNECIRLGKEKGCDHAFVPASNIRSQRLFDKLGFKRLKAVKYSEWMYEGQAVFDGYDDGYGTEECVVFAKKIV